MTAGDDVQDTHQELLISVGALALGTLEAADEARVRAHLAACDECRAAYDELAGVPRLLAIVSAEEAASGPPLPDDGLLERLLTAVRQERRDERIRRIRLAVGASLAAAACAAGIVIGVQQLSGGPGSPDAAPSVTSSSTSTPAPTPTDSATDVPAEVISASDVTTGVSASVALAPVAWGTSVDLTLRGVQPGYVCSLVAVGIDGVREVASTWTVPEGGYPGKGGGPGELSIGGAIGLERADISHFEIVEDNGDLLLTIPA